MTQRNAEDLDRELIELLNELRVALPGVQVLFAFCSRSRSQAAGPDLPDQRHSL